MRGCVSGGRSFVILTAAFALESRQHFASTFLWAKKRPCKAIRFLNLVPEGDSTAPYNLWSSERLSVKGYNRGYNASPAGYPMVHQIALEGNAELSTTMNCSTFPDPPRSVHLYGNLGKEQRN